MLLAAERVNVNLNTSATTPKVGALCTGAAVITETKFEIIIKYAQLHIYLFIYVKSE